MSLRGIWLRGEMARGVERELKSKTKNKSKKGREDSHHGEVCVYVRESVSESVREGVREKASARVSESAIRTKGLRMSAPPKSCCGEHQKRIKLPRTQSPHLCLIDLLLALLVLSRLAGRIELLFMPFTAEFWWCRHAEHFCVYHEF